MAPGTTRTTSLARAQVSRAEGLTPRWQRAEGWDCGQAAPWMGPKGGARERLERTWVWRGCRGSQEAPRPPAVDTWAPALFFTHWETFGSLFGF